MHFLGLWDTVSSVGWLWDPPSYPFTANNPSVDVVWHAISVDERRWLFRQNRVHQARRTQELHELWFPGVHSDVGGGTRKRMAGCGEHRLGGFSTLPRAQASSSMPDA